ncbi:MAG: TIGR03619 family F420-dependent LLM class oxidoreductase [Microthrixaceae bacterium]
MKFSLALPMLPAHHFLPLAQAAEAAGYASVAVPESVFFPETVSAKYPYSSDGGRFWAPETPFLDPFVAIPAMAAVTERISFFTNVLKLGIRDPLLVAKTVSSIGALADGRLGLGVGLSWIPEEFEWLGKNMRTRGARTNEAIEIIRLVCSGEFVEYHGKHYEFGRLMVRPVPTQPIPIFVGGLSEPGLQRAARLADGWISVANTSAEVAEVLPKLVELRAEYGRSELPFEIKALCTDVFDAAGFEHMAKMGVTEAMVCPWYFRPGNPEELEQQLDSVAWFGEDFVSQLSD